MEIITTVKEEYWEFIRNLRNDIRVRDNFIQTAEIGREEHFQHMFRCSAHYSICLDSGEPVGFIRANQQGDISVCVIPEKQGNGIGSYLLRDLMERKPDSYAKIKIDNKKSVALFEGCGFEKKFYIMEKR